MGLYRIKNRILDSSGSVAPAGNANFLKLSDYANLATAVTAIGSTKAVLDIDEAATVSSAITIPATLLLNHNGFLISKSGSGTIDFDGIGLVAADSQIPLFSGFDAGDITWTGTVWPATVSTELWDTGDNSLSERLHRANAAFGTKQIKFECYPRTITRSVDFAANTEVYLNGGNYPSTFDFTAVQADPGSYPEQSPYQFGLHENTVFHGPRNAVLNESTGLFGARFIEPSRYGQVNWTSGDSLKEARENIHIRGLTFRGHPDVVSDGSGSGIMMGNAHNSSIRDCTFEELHNYATIFGGSGATGNHAYNSDITGNIYLKCAVQAIAIVNGHNCKIVGNYMDGTNSEFGGQFIDIEPNSAEDTADDILVEDNWMIVRDDVGPNLGGIAFQAAGGTPSIKGGIIRGNKIFAAHQASGTSTRLAGGIGVSGLLDGIVENNVVRWGLQFSYFLQGCRNVVFRNNTDFGSIDNGYGLSCRFFYCSNMDITDNSIRDVDGITASAGILEAQYIFPVPTPTATNTITPNSVGAYRIYTSHIGLQVFFNGTLYTITAFDDPESHVLTVSPDPGVVGPQTFTDGDVNTTTDAVTIPNHGYQTGALAKLSTTGVLPAHTAPDVYGVDGLVHYYLIRTDANTIKLANSLANALAGTAIDITAAAGGGTHTVTLELQTRFSNNTFSGNHTPNGISLDATGTSQILSTWHDREVTTVANTDHTASSVSGIILYTSLSTGRTVTLPTATTCKGKEIIIKDGSGAAGTHNITIDGNDDETIDGATTYVISTNYGQVRIKSTGTGWITL